MRWTTAAWVIGAAWAGHAAWHSDAWTLARAENSVAYHDAEAARWARTAAVGLGCYEDAGGRYGVASSACPADDAQTRRLAADAAAYHTGQARRAQAKVTRLRGH